MNTAARSTIKPSEEMSLSLIGLIGEAEKSHINVSRVLQEALMVKLGVSR